MASYSSFDPDINRKQLTIDATVLQIVGILVYNFRTGIRPLYLSETPKMSK